jgi:glycerophosphoryl diester phosphodiesterase
MKNRVKIISKKIILLFFIFSFFGCLSNRNTTGNELSEMASSSIFNITQPQIIAHRGFWNFEGCVENSIRSLQAAAELGVFGSEFDVHLTADDIPVIYHDNTIKGTNIIIQQVPYDAIKDVVLSNGEKLPTLDDYLEAGKTLSIKLILEIKPHATPERDRKAAQIVADKVKYFDLENKVEYATFSVEIGKELIRLKPDNSVWYVSGNLTPAELKEYGFSTLSYQFRVFESHPEYLTEAKELGLNRAVWTVNDLSLMERLIDQGVIFFTTDIPLQVKEYLEQRAHKDNN